eukprot:EG_transcript_6164
MPNFLADAEATPESGYSTASPRMRLAAFRQLASTLQQQEDQKGFNSAFANHFTAFAPSREEAASFLRGPAVAGLARPSDEAAAVPFAAHGRSLSAYPGLLAEDALPRPRCPSPSLPKATSFLGPAAAPKRPPKSLPRMGLPVPSIQGGLVEPDFDALTSPSFLGCTVSPTYIAVNALASMVLDDGPPPRTAVLELKGKAQQPAEIVLQSGHLFFYHEGEAQPYRIENLGFSATTEVAPAVVQVEGPFCVPAKVQFADAAALPQWVAALCQASQPAPGTPAPTSAVEKAGTLVKVKDTMFGNRSVVARLADHHLQLFSSATSRAPYRVEHLLGATVRATDTCFFLEGPYCLPGIYKLGDTEQAAEWAAALQRAIDAADGPKAGLPKVRARGSISADDRLADTSFQAQLALQLRSLQAALLGVPAPRRAEALACVARLTAELSPPAPVAAVVGRFPSPLLQSPSRDTLF